MRLLLDCAWLWSAFDPDAEMVSGDEKLHSSESAHSLDLQPEECLLEDDRLSVSSHGMNCCTTVRETLREWDLALDADEQIPLLIVPSAIAYLILHSKWSTLLLRAWWHHRLVNGSGRFFDKQHLFPGANSLLRINLRGVG